jgi:hypothetical protein
MSVRSLGRGGDARSLWFSGSRGARSCFDQKSMRVRFKWYGNAQVGGRLRSLTDPSTLSAVPQVHDVIETLESVARERITADLVPVVRSHDPPSTVDKPAGSRRRSRPAHCPRSSVRARRASRSNDAGSGALRPEVRTGTGTSPPARSPRSGALPFGAPASVPGVAAGSHSVGRFPGPHDDESRR